MILNLEHPKFRKGLQIVYIPTHVLEKEQGNIVRCLRWPGVEFGFMYAEAVSGIRCRYWRVGHLGELRTRANSELTLLENLFAFHTVDQEVVDRAIELIEKEQADAATLFG